MLKKQTKFNKGIIKKKLKFAFKPIYIDGGKYKIWFRFYYTLYKRINTYLNWDMPDEFSSIGDFSKKGMIERFNNLKSKDKNTHWEEDDNFQASFMKSNRENSELKLIQ